MPLSGWTAGIVPFVLAGLLAGPAVGGSSHAPVVPLVVTASPDWSTYDTGRVQLVFPSPLPAIQILQDVNGSAAAWLSLEHVDELGPTDSSHPVVVRTASPEAVAGFNTTNPGSTPAWPLTLAADVKVQTSGVPLWSAPASAAVNQTWPNVGNTSISVNYTLANPSDGGQGVLFQWTVSNWPWVSSGDLLAVEFELRV
ncbi:MAG TPA: hypothetical protein VJS68_03750, partial [Thermoplasmata archaeon]|nr:hypothetical protein [Thermoplasmata archaeon]